MANNLILPNGNMVTIFDNEDFRNLIHETLGDDAVRYLDEMVEDTSKELEVYREGANKVDKLLSKLEKSLQAKRLDRNRLTELVDSIQSIVYDWE